MPFRKTEKNRKSQYSTNNSYTPQFWGLVTLASVTGSYFFFKNNLHITIVSELRSLKILPDLPPNAPPIPAWAPYLFLTWWYLPKPQEPLKITYEPVELNLLQQLGNTLNFIVGSCYQAHEIQKANNEKTLQEDLSILKNNRDVEHKAAIEAIEKKDYLSASEHFSTCAEYTKEINQSNGFSQMLPDYVTCILNQADALYRAKEYASAKLTLDPIISAKNETVSIMFRVKALNLRGMINYMQYRVPASHYKQVKASLLEESRNDFIESLNIDPGQNNVKLYLEYLNSNHHYLVNRCVYPLNNQKIQPTPTSDNELVDNTDLIIADSCFILGEFEKSIVLYEDILPRLPIRPNTSLELCLLHIDCFHAYAQLITTHKKSQAPIILPLIEPGTDSNNNPIYEQKIDLKGAEKRAIKQFNSAVMLLDDSIKMTVFLNRIEELINRGHAYLLLAIAAFKYQSVFSNQHSELNHVKLYQKSINQFELAKQTLDIEKATHGNYQSLENQIDNTPGKLLVNAGISDSFFYQTICYQKQCADNYFHRNKWVESIATYQYLLDNVSNSNHDIDLHSIYFNYLKAYIGIILDHKEQRSINLKQLQWNNETKKLYYVLEEGIDKSIIEKRVSAVFNDTLNFLNTTTCSNTEQESLQQAKQLITYGDHFRALADIIANNKPSLFSQAEHPNYLAVYNLAVEQYKKAKSLLNKIIQIQSLQFFQPNLNEHQLLLNSIQIKIETCQPKISAKKTVLSNCTIS